MSFPLFLLLCLVSGTLIGLSTPTKGMTRGRWLLLALAIFMLMVASVFRGQQMQRDLAPTVTNPASASY